MEGLVINGSLILKTKVMCVCVWGGGVGELVGVDVCVGG
jgi:hypothetical protein